jgi:hypothetical protein
MKNWFETLNAALESENLIETFPVGQNLGYNETIRYASAGRFVTIYRNERGQYERPVHYATKCEDFAQIIRGE